MVLSGCFPGKLFEQINTREKRDLLLFSRTLVAALQLCECEVALAALGSAVKIFFGVWRGFSKEILNHTAGINHVRKKDDDSWLGRDLTFMPGVDVPLDLGMLL